MIFIINTKYAGKYQYKLKVRSVAIRGLGRFPLKSQSFGRKLSRTSFLFGEKNGQLGPFLLAQISVGHLVGTNVVSLDFFGVVYVLLFSCRNFNIDIDGEKKQKLSISFKNFKPTIFLRPKDHPHPSICFIASMECPCK